MILEKQVSYVLRWRDILMKEGLLPSITRALSFIRWAFYRNERLYFYRSVVADQATESYCIAEPDGFSLKVITDTTQVKKLMADGLQLDSFLLANDKRLRNGAIALCIFKEKDLVYMSWLAITREGKDAVTDIPLPVDFAAGEACVGRTFRNPKHWRSSGGFTYFMHVSISHYLQQRGYKAFIFIVDESNTIMINTMFKRTGMKPLRRVRYIKLLWWQYWRESSLDNSNPAAA